MTTASAEKSRTPSMPLNALPESAALPSGPAMWTVRPGDPEAMFRRESAAGPALFQPSWPRLTGTIVSIALPSRDTNGPVTWPWTTPATPAKRLASAVALALSAAVTPAGRSYTTTAGKTLGDTTLDRSASACVDSAADGSHDWASFFSTPVSLPDSGPASATTTSQNTSTSHLVRRPAGTPAIPRILLTLNPLVPVCPDPGETITRPVTHRRSPRHSGNSILTDRTHRCQFFSGW